jgi:plastocyanin
VVRKTLVLLFVAIPIAFFAACGDDDDDDTETAAAPETPAEETPAPEPEDSGGASGGQTIDISETEFALDPANPTAEAGEVTFAITNDGSTVHNLEVEGNGVEEVSDDIEGGQSTELTVDLEPGTYEIYCAIGNHADLGMEGELTVE